jgi:3-oxoadipate enol-lactonase
MKTNGFAEVNGTRLYYEMIGEGEVLVLLHSGYTDLRLWDDQFNLFGKHFKVIRYDIEDLESQIDQLNHFRILKT